MTHRSALTLLACALFLTGCGHTATAPDAAAKSSDASAAKSSDAGAAKSGDADAAKSGDAGAAKDGDAGATKSGDAAAKSGDASAAKDGDAGAAPAEGHGAGGGSNVRTAFVRSGALPQLAVGYGTVAGGANAKAALAFAQPGRIASVDVSVGERVAAGAVLARLDARPWQSELEQARANVAAAQAALRKAQLGVRPQQVAQTDAQLRGATTQVALARAQAERETRLLALGIAAQSDVDSARAAVASATAQRDVLAQQHSSEAHPWQPDVDAAGAAVAQAQSAADAAAQKVALTRLVAPFAGVVVARLHNDGESVDATTPVVEVASDAPPVFTAQFAPADAAHLHAGDSATVELQGTAASAAGTIVAIDPAQGEAHTVAVLVRVHVAPEMRTAFGLGAYGTASVRVGTRRGLIVPVDAVVTDAATGAVQVFRKDGDRFEPVPIALRARVADRALVDAPTLRSGDRVATQGAYELLTPQQSPKADKD